MHGHQNIKALYAFPRQSKRSFILNIRMI